VHVDGVAVSDENAHLLHVRKERGIGLVVADDLVEVGPGDVDDERLDRAGHAGLLPSVPVPNGPGRVAGW